MKTFEEIMTRKLSKKESNLILGLVAVIGMLVLTLALRNHEATLTGDSAWFWVGFNMMIAGLLGLIAPSSSSDEERN